MEAATVESATAAESGATAHFEVTTATAESTTAIAESWTIGSGTAIGSTVADREMQSAWRLASRRVLGSSRSTL